MSNPPITKIGLPRPTALIADDEPLLRTSLERLLAQIWPELQIVAAVRNGREAVESFEALLPNICFLDVHMPGLSGIEAARFISRRAHIVFVTAYDQYAVQAFNHGALDYLVKPIEFPRLVDTVSRLKARLMDYKPVREGLADNTDTELLLERLASQVLRKTTSPFTRWLRVAVGQAVRIVAVDEIDFFRAEDKYTNVVWHDKENRRYAGLIRTSLHALIPQLDPEQFIQSHRSVVVNLAAIGEVVRNINETASIRLRYSDDILPVSRTFLQHFRMM